MGTDVANVGKPAASLTAMDANVGPALFLGLGTGILDSILGIRRLIRSPNKNVERTTGAVSPLARAALCLAGLILPAIAAPIFVGLICAMAVYNTTKLVWSLYMGSSYNQNEESRRLYKADRKQNAINAAITVGLAILVFALFASPVGYAAAIGLSVVSYVVTVAYAVYTLIRFVRNIRDPNANDKKIGDDLPDHINNDVNQDQNALVKASYVSYDQKSKLDFYFRVNRKSVMSEIAHRDNAHHYLMTEIQTKIASLQAQIANKSGLFGSAESEKRIAKRDILQRLNAYLTHLNANPQEFAGANPMEAFETFATSQHFDMQAEQDMGMNPAEFTRKMRLAHQSFFANVGDVDDILEAFYAYYRYRSANQYATGHNPVEQQQPAYQPGFMHQQGHHAPPVGYPQQQPYPGMPQGYAPLNEQPVVYGQGFN